MRKVITITVLSFILAWISYIFWYNEWRYNLPTPIPKQYSPPAIGSVITLHNYISTPQEKPLFIHFFNPDCPCSRFNMPYVKSLIKKYRGRVSFIVICINKQGNCDPNDIKKRYDLDVPVFSDQLVADKCGVYSTPQAVIIDTGSHLYYRGNYNRSRYCTDTRSNFAQIALDSLLNHISNPTFSSYALKAYGCSLPYCSR